MNIYCGIPNKNVIEFYYCLFNGIKYTNGGYFAMTPQEFREACAELNLNYTQMAKCLHVSPATVANWAKGKSRISMPTADYVQRLLHKKRNPDPKKEAAELINQLFSSKKKEKTSSKRRLINGIDLLAQYQNAKVLIVDDKNSADFLNQELDSECFIAIMLPTELPEMSNINLGLLNGRECICLPSFYKSRRSKKAQKVLFDSIDNLEEIKNPANMICFFANRWKIISSVHEAAVSKEQFIE